ncbi:MAG: hypothetical protein AAGF47_11260 [Planctomycetota bacterium]
MGSARWVWEWVQVTARPDTRIWADSDAASRATAVAAAADALRAGRLVVLPTETVYGVFASAGDPASDLASGLASGLASIEGLERLSGLMGEQAARGAAWHTDSVDDAAAALRIEHPDHRRLVDRLLPGPVSLRRDGAAGEPAQAVRVVDDAAAAAVLAAAGGRVLACAFSGESAAGRLGDGRAVARILGDAPLLKRLAELGVAVIIDGGRTRLGGVSTLVRLLVGGGIETVREGVVPARRLDRAMTRSVLFVCTGNKCRSPMAEAIAREAAADGSLGRVVAASAGVSAAPGGPMTREAARALRAAGVGTADAGGGHRSRPVTAEQIEAADEIYALTAGHLAALESAFPGARGRAVLLDPAGGDVADPFGGPQAEYDATCRVLIDLVRRRLGGPMATAAEPGPRPAGGA